MLLGEELEVGIVEKVWLEVQKDVDADEVTEADVKKWAKGFVKDNNPVDIQPDLIDTFNFFEWYDN